MIEKYFKTEAEIHALFRGAFEALEKKGYEFAAPLFEEAFLHDPYPIAVHYRLAGWLARSGHVHQSLHHLEICYDLDASYLDKMLSDTAITGNIDEPTIKNIEKTKLSRMWQVMNFKQIEPVYDTHGISLYFNDANKDYISDFCRGLHDRLQRYFELDSGFIWVGRDYDRKYCGYEKVFTAFKEISPFVKDVRFFMTCESRSYVDEIRIADGRFYSYRHDSGENCYSDQLALYERLYASNRQDAYLQQFIGNEHFKWAEHKITYGDRLKEAKGHLDKVLAFTPQHPKLDYLLSKYYSKTGDEQLAHTFLLKSAASPSAGFEELYHAGVFELTQSEYKKALGYLKQAINADPHSAMACLQAGIASQYLDLVEDATTYYDKLIEETPEHSYDTLIDAGTELFERFRNYALMELCYTHAILKATDYLADLQQKKDAAYEFRRIRIIDNISHAYAQLILHAPSAAVKSTYEDKLLEITPASEMSWSNKASVYKQRGNLTEAEACYKNGLLCRNNDIRKQYGQAVLLYKRHEYDKALQMAHQIVEKDPGYSNGWAMIGAAYISLKNYAQGLDAYKKVIDLDTDSSIGYHGAGLANHWMKQYEPAIEYYNKALEKNPSLHEVVSDLASCYESLGELKKALDLAEKAIELTPDYFHPYYVKACVYVRQNRQQEALEMVRQSLTLAPAEVSRMMNEPVLEPLHKLKEWDEMINSFT